MVAAVVESLAEDDAVVALGVVVVVGKKRSGGVRGQRGGKSAIDELEGGTVSDKASAKR